MNGVGLIGAIIIGILAGWIAEKVMKRNQGLLTNLVVGVIGSIIGGYLATNVFHIAFAGFVGSLIVSALGAILLLFLLGLFKRR